MDLWHFQRRLTSLLLGWAAASIGVGLAVGRGGDALRRGVGEQYVGWGAVNAIIAIIGLFALLALFIIFRLRTPEPAAPEPELAPLPTPTDTADLDLRPTDDALDRSRYN